MNLASKYRIIFKVDDSFAGVSFVEGLGISGYKNLDFVAIYENKNFEAFLSEEDIEKASNIGFDFCIHREKTQKLHLEINNLLQETRKFWAELDSMELSKLDSSQLKKLFIKYVDFTVLLYDYFSLAEFYYFYKVEDKIQDSINNKDDLATLLTSPKRANIITEEQFKRTELALKIKEDPNKRGLFMNQHLKDYDFIPYALGESRWTKDYFNKEVEKLLKKSASELTAKRDQILEDDRNLKEKQETLLKIKLPQEISDLIQSVKEWQEIKWLLRVFINRTFLTTKCLDVKFLREISKRTKYTITQISNMYYQETLGLLDGKKIDKEEIKKRIGLYAAFNHNSKITFLFGEEVKDFAKQVRDRTVDYYQKFNELKGRVASPGKITGKARVFGGGKEYKFYTELKRMKKGEIIVADSTSPEYMPAIIKAAAIVADEGGITSHAAIISRELKIPCIVGTHYAMRSIKTGDTIEVDANSGVVKIL